MAVINSEQILRKRAYDVLKHAREAGESVVLTRDGNPEIILLTFDAYIQMRTGAPAEYSDPIEQLEQQAVDSTVCMRNCIFRSPKPGSVVRKK